MDDPFKPYKAYVALLLAFLTTFIAQTQGQFPWYVDALLISLVAAAGVYVTPNPKR